MTAGMVIETERSNPYVGFRPFLTPDALYFFGRDAQISALLQCLQRHRFVSVVGNSGSGKSSLVLAGVIPTLLGGFLASQRDQWLIASMRPGDSPLENLAQSFIETLGADFVGMSRAQFADEMRARGVAVVTEVLSRRTEHTNLLLLADQFEELFAFQAAAGSELTDIPGRPVSHDIIEERIRRQADSQTFVSILMAIAALPGEHVYVVTTMRTDFMGDCDRFAGLPELITSAGYLVPRLTRQDLRDAIEGPARLKRVRVTSRLCDFVLNEIGDKPDLLPLLQHALHRTWEARAESGDTGLLDLVHLEKVGGLRRALPDEAESLIAGFDERMVATVFRRLTRIDSGRRRVRRACKLSELLAVTGASREQLLPLLDRLTAEGTNLLFRSRGREDNDPRYDISHESLIRQWDRLQRWIDEERELAKFYTELCEKAARLRDTGELSETSMAARRELRQDVTRRQLSEEWASRYAGEVPATWREVQWYLLQSRRSQRKWLVAWSAMAAAVLLLVSALVARQRQDRRWSEEQAEMSNVAKLSESDPTYGVWLASRWASDRFADPMFMAALDNLEQRFTAIAEFTNVASFDPIAEGDGVVVALRDGRVHVVQSDGRGAPIATLDVAEYGGVQSLLWLADSTVLVATFDHRLLHWHYRSSENFAHELGEDVNVMKLIRLADGARAIVGGEDATVYVFERDGLRRLPLTMSVLAANPTLPGLIAGYRSSASAGSRRGGAERIDSIVQYDVDAQRIVWSLPAKNTYASAAQAVYASDGASLLIARNGDADSLFEISSTGRLLWTQKSSTWVRAMSDAGSARRFFVSDYNGDVRQVGHDLYDGQPPVARHQTAAAITRVPGREWLVSGDDDGDVRANWTGFAETGIAVPMRGHSTGVGVEVRATASHLFSLDGIGLLRVWAVDRLLSQFEPPSLSPDVTTFSAMAARAGTIMQPDHQGDLYVGTQRLTIPGVDAAASSPLAVADDGTHVAACLEIGRCWIWSLSGDSIDRVVPIDVPSVSANDSAAFSEHGASLFVKHGDDTLYEVSTRTGRTRHRFAMDSASVWQLSPDGRALAFEREGAIVVVLLSDTTRTAQVADSSLFFKWRWGSLGARLIVGIGDTLRLYSPTSSGALRARTLHVSATDSLADFDVDADAQWLAVLRGDRSVSVYAIESSDTLRRELRLSRPRVSLNYLRFLPWDHALLGGTYSGGAELWEWRPRRFSEDSTGRPSWSASFGRQFRGVSAAAASTLNGQYVSVRRSLTHHPSIMSALYNPPPFLAADTANRQVTLLVQQASPAGRRATWFLSGESRRQLLLSRRAHCLDQSAIEGTTGASPAFPEGCAARLFSRSPATPIRPRSVAPVRLDAGGPKESKR